MFPSMPQERPAGLTVLHLRKYYRRPALSSLKSRSYRPMSKNATSIPQTRKLFPAHLQLPGIGELLGRFLQMVGRPLAIM